MKYMLVRRGTEEYENRLARIVEWRKKGFTYRYIGELLGLSISSIVYICKQNNIK